MFGQTLMESHIYYFPCMSSILKPRERAKSLLASIHSLKCNTEIEFEVKWNQLGPSGRELLYVKPTYGHFANICWFGVQLETGCDCERFIPPSVSLVSRGPIEVQVGRTVRREEALKMCEILAQDELDGRVVLLADNGDVGGFAVVDDYAADQFGGIGGECESEELTLIFRQFVVDDKLGGADVENNRII